MSTLTIELPAGLKAKLNLAARRRGQSPREFLRATIQASLQPAAPARGPNLYERSRDLCGSVNGGPADLARNKRHLKGYGS